MQRLIQDGGLPAVIFLAAASCRSKMQEVKKIVNAKEYLNSSHNLQCHTSYNPSHLLYDLKFDLSLPILALLRISNSFWKNLLTR